MTVYVVGNSRVSFIDEMRRHEVLAGLVFMDAGSRVTFDERSAYAPLRQDDDVMADVVPTQAARPPRLTDADIVEAPDIPERSSIEPVRPSRGLSPTIKSIASRGAVMLAGASRLSFASIEASAAQFEGETLFLIGDSRFSAFDVSTQDLSDEDLATIALLLSKEDING